jgi:catechol 2,3-dioxygenase-like lactoylglutathione lyase family enzyme
MIKANGVHHLAISTANIKSQIEFFSDVLGMELVALFPMHGVPGGLHGFLEGSPQCLISFVQLAENANVEIEFGKTHAGNGASPSAPGSMQHLALNVDDDDALLAMRDRIRSRGVNVIGPIDHGMCRSIYFAGPEALTLEIATSDEAIDANAWIDPDTVAEAGISDVELERFKSPEAFRSPPKPIAQPPMDPSKPHMRYPKALYQKLLNTSDAELTASASYAEPPVAPGSLTSVDGEAND